MEWMRSVKELFVFARGRDKRIDGLFDTLRSMTESNPMWSEQHEMLAREMRDEVKAARIERWGGLLLVVIVGGFLILTTTTDLFDRAPTIEGEDGIARVECTSDMSSSEMLSGLGYGRNARLAMVRRPTESNPSWWVRKGQAESELGYFELGLRRGEIERVNQTTRIGTPLNFDNSIRFLLRLEGYEPTREDNELIWKVAFGLVASGDTLWTQSPLDVRSTSGGTPQITEVVDGPDWNSPYIVSVGVGNGGDADRDGDFDHTWDLQATARRIAP